MALWQVWQVGDGADALVSTHEDRIEAMAAVLALNATSAHARISRLSGPPDPACVTNRDLYVRLVDAGRRMNDADRGLAEFLHAWWAVGRTLADHDRFEPDEVAAMITTAATLTPAPLPPGWRTARYPFVEASVIYADWEAIIFSQLADLADLADAGPLSDLAYFGLDIPRPVGAERATGDRWYNFDPRGYLECGLAGTFGGWDEDDGIRANVPGDTEPTSRPHHLDPISWTDLAELAYCGQICE